MSDISLLASDIISVLQIYQYHSRDRDSSIYGLFRSGILEIYERLWSALMSLCSPGQSSFSQVSSIQKVCRLFWAVQSFSTGAEDESLDSFLSAKLSDALKIGSLGSMAILSALIRFSLVSNSIFGDSFGFSLENLDGSLVRIDFSSVDSVSWDNLNSSLLALLRRERFDSSSEMLFLVEEWVVNCIGGCNGNILRFLNPLLGTLLSPSVLFTMGPVHWSSQLQAAPFIVPTYACVSASGHLPFDICSYRLAIEGLAAILRRSRDYLPLERFLAVSCGSCRPSLYADFLSASQVFSCECAPLSEGKTALSDCLFNAAAMGCLAQLAKGDSDDTVSFEQIDSLRHASLGCLEELLCQAFSSPSTAFCQCRLSKLASFLLRVSFLSILSDHLSHVPKLLNIVLLIMRHCPSVRPKELFDCAVEQTEAGQLLEGPGHMDFVKTAVENELGLSVSPSILVVLKMLLAGIEKDQKLCFGSFLRFLFASFGASRALARSCILPVLCICMKMIGLIREPKASLAFFESFRLVFEWYLYLMVSCSPLAASPANPGATYGLPTPPPLAIVTNPSLSWGSISDAPRSTKHYPAPIPTLLPDDTGTSLKGKLQQPPVVEFDIQLFQIIISSVEYMIDNDLKSPGLEVDAASMFRDILGSRKASSALFSVSPCILPIIHVWSSRYVPGADISSSNLPRLLSFLGLSVEIDCRPLELLNLLADSFRDIYPFSSRNAAPSSSGLFFASSSFEFSKRKSASSVVSEASILGLMEHFVTSQVPTDEITMELWPSLNGFLRDCISSFAKKKHLLCPVLKLYIAIIGKASSKRAVLPSAEDKRILKESQEGFVKSLDVAISYLVKNMESSLSSFSESLDDIMVLARYILVDLLEKSQIAVLENERLSSVGSTLLFSLIFPLFKAHLAKGSKGGLNSLCATMIWFMSNHGEDVDLSSYGEGPIRPSFVILNYAGQLLLRLSSIDKLVFPSTWKKDFYEDVFFDSAFFALPLFHLESTGAVCWCCRRSLIERVFCGGSINGQLMGETDGGRFLDILERLGNVGTGPLSAFLAVGGMMVGSRGGVSNEPSEVLFFNGTGPSFPSAAGMLPSALSGIAGGLGTPESSPRIVLMKKISYVLLCSPVDHHLPFLPVLHEKVVDICKLVETIGTAASCNTDIVLSSVNLALHMLSLFKVILARFSLRNLGNFWPIIYNLLHLILKSLSVSLSVSSSSTDIFSSESCKLFFSLCRFVEFWIKISHQDSSSMHWWWLIGNGRTDASLLSIAGKMCLFNEAPGMDTAFSRLLSPEHFILSSAHFDFGQLVQFVHVLKGFEATWILTDTWAPLEVQQSLALTLLVESEYHLWPAWSQLE